MYVNGFSCIFSVCCFVVGMCVNGRSPIGYLSASYPNIKRINKKHAHIHYFLDNYTFPTPCIILLTYASFILSPMSALTQMSAPLSQSRSGLYYADVIVNFYLQGKE